MSAQLSAGHNHLIGVDNSVVADMNAAAYSNVQCSGPAGQLQQAQLPSLIFTDHPPPSLQLRGATFPNPDSTDSTDKVTSFPSSDCHQPSLSAEAPATPTALVPSPSSTSQLASAGTTYPNPPPASLPSEISPTTLPQLPSTSTAQAVTNASGPSGTGGPSQQMQSGTGGQPQQSSAPPLSPISESSSGMGESVAGDSGVFEASARR